jgi:hypothetical protein
VVGATSSVAGYAGGLDRKRALLEIEHAGALRAGLAREALLRERRRVGCRRKTSRRQLMERGARPFCVVRAREGTAGN